MPLLMTLQHDSLGKFLFHVMYQCYANRHAPKSICLQAAAGFDALIATSQALDDHGPDSNYASDSLSTSKTSSSGNAASGPLWDTQLPALKLVARARYNARKEPHRQAIHARQHQRHGQLHGAGNRWLHLAAGLALVGGLIGINVFGRGAMTGLQACFQNNASQHA